MDDLEIGALALALLDRGAYESGGIAVHDFQDPVVATLWDGVRGAPEGPGVRDYYERHFSRAGIDTITGLRLLDRVLSATPAGSFDELRNRIETRAIRHRLASILADRGLTAEELRAACATIPAGPSGRTNSPRWSTISWKRGDLRPGLSAPLGLAKAVPYGIPVGQITSVFGETGMYKSTLVANLVDSVIYNGGCVFLATLEDSASHTLAARLARVSGIPISQISEGVDEITSTRVQRIRDTDHDYLDRVTVVEDRGSWQDIEARISAVHADRPLSLAVVDYIDLLSGCTSFDAYGEVMKSAQLLAARLQIALIMVHQITKSKMAARRDYRPQWYDVHGGAYIDKYPKLALGVYMPSRYEAVPATDQRLKSVYQKSPSDYERTVELWVRKNKAGPVNKRILVTVEPTTGLMSATGVV